MKEQHSITSTVSFAKKLVILSVFTTILAMFPLPYHFYILVRVVIFSCAAWFFWQSLQRYEFTSIILLLGVLAVFNPVFLTDLDSKPLWIIADLAAVAVFILATTNLRRFESESETFSK